MSDISIIAELPAPGTQAVSRSTEIVLSVDILAGNVIDLANTLVDINGTRAWTGTPGFVYPDFSGSGAPLPLNLQFALHIQPRRRFVYGVKVTVSGQIKVTNFFIPTKIFSWDFFIQAEPRKQGALVAQRTVYDLPLPGLTATRAFQQILKGTLLTPSTASTEIVLLRRARSTTLRTLFQGSGPAFERQLEQLQLVRQSDIVNSQPAIDELNRIAVLWPGMLAELNGLGVETATTQLLDDVWQTAHPVNQLSAACAGVLLAGRELQAST